MLELARGGELAELNLTPEEMAGLQVCGASARVWWVVGWCKHASYGWKPLRSLDGAWEPHLSTVPLTPVSGAQGNQTGYLPTPLSPWWPSQSGPGQMMVDGDSWRTSCTKRGHAAGKLPSGHGARPPQPEG